MPAAMSKDELLQLVRQEIDAYSEEGIRGWDLYLKQQEIQQWLPTQDQEQIAQVKRSIWKPVGRSDFRRIEPELIFVRSHFQVQARDIWGDPSVRYFESSDDHQAHWQILRKLVSTARDTGGGGMRTMKILVRDKISRQYLGVICISSDFLDLPPRDKVIGWNTKDFQRPQGRLFGKLNNLAQGQAIVPTQPFGNAYNGVKLLALLCLSKEIADEWERYYGDKLVGVTTTALWGTDKDVSSYDGLQPYWYPLGKTSGNTKVKFTDKTYEAMKLWLLETDPAEHHKLFTAKNAQGKMLTRDSKNRCTALVMQRLGIPVTQRDSKAERLAYFARLYKNTDAFLKGEITADQLEPAFDNSTDALVHFWRFGLKGDTTRRLPPAKKKQIQREHDIQPDLFKLNLDAPAKGRIDDRVGDAKRKGQIARIDADSQAFDWYEDLATLSFDEAKAKYLSQIAR